MGFGGGVGGDVEVEGVEGAEVGVGDGVGGCILLVKGLLFGHDCRSVFFCLTSVVRYIRFLSIPFGQCKILQFNPSRLKDSLNHWNRR